ncbi:Ankyrin_repeat protein 1 [Hexamita inflata]|uniref:Ankyrin repeat protein 1 n=1 Tax=Hexamita inflata TaxID=28002 RepID=A0AA86NMW8_9EUKA|nr:Ankyrin repeat protein 1 [Hexamita inflata]
MSQVWFQAAENNELDTINKLKSKNLNRKNENGQTALMIAAQRGNINAVRVLADHEKGQICNEETALSLAIKNKKFDVANYLYEFEVKDQEDIIIQILNQYYDGSGPYPNLNSAYSGGTPDIMDIINHNLLDQNTFNAKLKEYQNTICKLQMKIENKDEELSEINIVFDDGKSMDQLQQLNDRLGAELTKFKAQLEEKDAIISTLQNQLKQQGDENNHVSEQLNKTIFELNQTQASLQTTQQQLKSEQEKLHLLNEAKPAHDHSSTDNYYRQQADKYQIQYFQLKDEKLQSELDIKKLTKELQSLQETTETEIKNKNEQNERLQKEIERLLSVQTQLNLQIQKSKKLEFEPGNSNQSEINMITNNSSFSVTETSKKKKKNNRRMDEETQLKHAQTDAEEIIKPIMPVIQPPPSDQLSQVLAGETKPAKKDNKQFIGVLIFILIALGGMQLMDK